MALPAGLFVEINSSATASNVNGGGFNPYNASFMTDLTTDANTANTNAPIVSSATYTFVAGDVNHWLYIAAGTNWTVGWYKIQSVAGGKATLEAAIGSANVEQFVNNRIIRNTVIGCATTGTPTGGTFGVDYTRSTAAAFARTDLVIATTTTLTSAAIPFGPQEVGNLIHITAGTGFTQGWYQILSVTGVTATVDRVCGTLASTGGTGKVGGAMSLGASDDDSVFELGTSSSTVAQRFFIKGSATYTMGGAVAVAATGNATCWGVVEGYASGRGDRPTGTSRPLLAFGANGCAFGSRFVVRNIQVTSTESNGILCNEGTYIEVKSTQTTTSSGQNAFTSNASGVSYINCEAMSIRGHGINSNQPGTFIYGCYIHDCGSDGIHLVGDNSPITIINNLIVNCKTNAISEGGSVTLGLYIMGNTIYGAENKLGVGILHTSGAKHIFQYNNIFYGLVTGVNHGDVNSAGFSDFNDYFNNTNDVVAANKWQKGAGDQALDPGFVSVTQRTGSSATTTSGNHLVQSGATFQTWGVAVGDVIQVVSGTGPTAGFYTILTVDSETQVTVNETLTANATANKVWQITQGRNFAIGTNLKALGNLGVFPGALTTGYTDIGAAQRQEAGAAAAGYRVNMRSMGN